MDATHWPSSPALGLDLCRVIDLDSRFSLPVVFCLSSELATVEPTSTGRSEGVAGSQGGEETSFGLNMFCREFLSEHLSLEINDCQGHTACSGVAGFPSQASHPQAQPRVIHL